MSEVSQNRVGSAPSEVCNGYTRDAGGALEEMIGFGGRVRMDASTPIPAFPLKGEGGNAIEFGWWRRRWFSAGFGAFLDLLLPLKRREGRGSNV